MMGYDVFVFNQKTAYDMRISDWIQTCALPICIEAFDCQPGIQGAHEKGGVEGQIGWFRRNHLVPVPEVDSLAELNALVDVWDIRDDSRRIGSRARTVGEHFATEQPLLAPLPTEPFETGRWFTPRVDRYAQISVRMNKYSVPACMVGRQVRVLLPASYLVVFDGKPEIARHERRSEEHTSELQSLMRISYAVF